MSAIKESAHGTYNMIEELPNNFYNLRWWVESAVPYTIHQAEKKYTSICYTPDSPECRIMSEDWDNLILLDACRFDQFKRLNTLQGKLETRTSLGSGTPEFLTNNFEGEVHHDTVYVTANPMYRIENIENVFHEIIDVWESEWDDQQKTVRPEKMVEATLEAYKKFPNKRLISHFMQPHYPFIGESAREIGDHAGFEWTYRLVQEGEGERDHQTVWKLLQEGEIDEKIVWEAYDENLEIALPHVKSLATSFDEKTVVTSDHGNLVNERITPFGKAVSGHPIGIYTDELRKVPWLVLKGKKRKEIRAEEPERDINRESDIVNERLADLGYADM